MATKKKAGAGSANKEVYIWTFEDEMEFGGDTHSSIDSCFSDAVRCMKENGVHSNVEIYKMVAKARPTTKLEIFE